MPATFDSPDAERHVVVVEHDLAELVGVMPRRHQHGGEHRGIVLWLLAEHLQSPVIDGGTRRSGEPLVTREDVVEPLLEQHRDGLAQAVEQVGRRSIREEAIRIRLQHFLPIPIRPRHPVGLRGGTGLVRDRVEAETGRQHETLSASS